MHRSHCNILSTGFEQVLHSSFGSLTLSLADFFVFAEPELCDEGLHLFFSLTVAIMK